MTDEVKKGFVTCIDMRTCEQCGAELKPSSNPNTSGLYYCSRFCVSIEWPVAPEPLGPYIEEME